MIKKSIISELVPWLNVSASQPLWSKALHFELPLMMFSWTFHQPHNQSCIIIIDIYIYIDIFPLLYYFLHAWTCAISIFFSCYNMYTYFLLHTWGKRKKKLSFVTPSVSPLVLFLNYPVSSLQDEIRNLCYILIEPQNLELLSAGITHYISSLQDDLRNLCYIFIEPQNLELLSAGVTHYI